MTKIGLTKVFLASTVLSGAFCLAAFAADEAEVVPFTPPGKDSNDGSIFSPPSSQNNFGGQNSTQFRRKGRHNQNFAKTPGWRQIRMLPSLSPSQRKEIQAIFKQAKQENQPEIEVMKGFRQKMRASLLQSGVNMESASKEQIRQARQKAMAANPEMQAQLQAFRAKMQERKQNVWLQVKSKLTAKQLEELEQMKKGEFRPPNS